MKAVNGQKVRYKLSGGKSAYDRRIGLVIDSIPGYYAGNKDRYDLRFRDHKVLRAHEDECRLPEMKKI